MAFKLKCHQPTNKTPPSFYIQSKGEHSGRPLRKPIPNCFAVYSDLDDLYSLVYVLYVGGIFKRSLRGSVIPFITIDDTKQVITANLPSISKKELLKQVHQVESYKIHLKQTLKAVGELHQALCLSVLKGT